MSIFSVQARKHTAFYDNLMSASVSRTPGRERAAAEPPFVGTRDTSSSESAREVSRSSEKSHVNRTHVVSAMSSYRGRLTLQRRSRRKTGTDRTREDTGTESSHNNTSPAPEKKRLTLQRRTRTPSMMDTTKSGQQQQQPTSKVLSEPNGRTPGSLFRTASLREAAPKLSGAPGAQTQRESSPSSSSSSRTHLLEARAHTFKTPTKKTPFEKIASKRDVFEKLSSKEAPKPVVHRSAGLERPQTRAHQPVAAPRVSKASPPGAHRPNTGLQDRKATSSSCAKPEATSDPSLVQTSEDVRQQESLKMENSAVTVAVRVRPFSARCVLCGLHKTSSERAHTQLLLSATANGGSAGVKPRDLLY